VPPGSGGLKSPGYLIFAPIRKIDPRVTKVPEPISVIGLLGVAAFASKMLKRKRQEDLLASVSLQYK